MFISLFILPKILLDIPRNPIFALGIPIVLGTLAGLPMRKGVKGEWYKNLVVPPGRLPRLVFPFVWTGFYAFDAYNGLILYWCQMVTSVVTSLFFFMGLAMAAGNSVLLTAECSYMTIVLDKPTNHLSTYFLAPCCAWLAYMTYLIGGIWWLNRGREGGDEKQ
ncbi:hypothetical protein JB92DRAFT_2904526 [Gautieria morchelliformis]|nr:hypothetical protein JB92DRAFT_2904526 [Gautieria morchelliformis]